MITITPLAQEKLSGYLAENKMEPKVRVYLSSGCGGGGISLVIDEPDDEDIKTKAGDLELFMEKQLFDLIGQVTVDFKEENGDSGFFVTSEKPAPVQDGGGCAGCTSCG